MQTISNTFTNITSKTGRITLVFCVLVIIMSSIEVGGEKIRNIQNRRVKQESGTKRKMLGGFQTASDLNNEEIQQPTLFVLESLEQGNDGGSYLSYASIVKQNPESSSYTAVPLEVFKQVVAGMIYKMKIGIFETTSEAKKKKCIGGLAVAVFRDLKGEFSVMKWGSEISCEEVETIMLKNSNKGESEDEESEDEEAEDNE
mmetsp:Transcript_6833/g.7440  ORF Transcript_6833/g.7440 Transcript_6833/m.7440 type:complete len:201 (+) Transcript_6833:58-660(+)